MGVRRSLSAMSEAASSPRNWRLADERSDSLRHRARLWSLGDAVGCQAIRARGRRAKHKPGYEKDRAYPAVIPPAREAPKVIPRLEERIRSKYDELLILRFKATNSAPYPFEWVDRDETYRLYGAALLRISKLYDERF